MTWILVILVLLAAVLGGLLVSALDGRDKAVSESMRLRQELGAALDREAMIREENEALRTQLSDIMIKLEVAEQKLSRKGCGQKGSKKV